MINTVPSALGNPTTILTTPRLVLLFNGLAVGAVTLATLLPMLTVVHYLWLDLAAVQQMTGLGQDALPAVTMGQKMAAAAAACLSTLPLCWGLIRLRTCLSSFAAGRPFDAAGIAGLRDFALGALLTALAQLAGHTLIILALTWTAAPGQKMLSISIDSNMLILVLFAGTITALAWAMEKAAVIAEENSQFI